jgi:hypothetical protein
MTKNKDSEKKEQSYTIKQQVLIPYELTFKVTAESPEKALEKINSASSHQRKIMPGTRKIGAKVFEHGKLTVLLTKKY